MFNYKRPLVVAMAVASLLTSVAADATDDGPLVTQIVDTFYKIYGTHPGFRVNHAKGVVVKGSFLATPAASALSRAALFNGSRIPVTVRFSNDGGIPTVPDGAPSNPKGMAIKFHLPDGATFPASFGSAPTPGSFADQEYHGINAFIFVDKAGHRRAVRYIMSPEKSVTLTVDEAARKPPDFLVNELPQRIAKRPVVFHLEAQLAAVGDQTKDPSQPWPDSREVVDLGVLTLDQPVADTLEAQKKLLFLPTRLTDGIELSDDRLPVIRSEVYAVAFARRGG